ncbi:MAG: T9SS type A sorting domain-containing protein, partial [Saprospiraceae bacterium]|nr:T9SS type A sorting domain-containing protein [Saprospiraceae bacterium]
TNQPVSGQLQLVDLAGRMWMSEEMNIPPGQVMRKQFEALQTAPSGMYFLVVRTANQAATRRLIKL